MRLVFGGCTKQPLPSTMGSRITIDHIRSSAESHLSRIRQFLDWYVVSQSSVGCREKIRDLKRGFNEFINLFAPRAKSTNKNYSFSMSPAANKRTVEDMNVPSPVAEEIVSFS